MSAPPIGSTVTTPRRPTSTRIVTNQIGEAPVLIAPIPTTTDAATDPRNTTTLRGGCRRPTVRGLLGRICWSLRKAMIEPQNESDPMIAAKRQATTS